MMIDGWVGLVRSTRRIAVFLGSLLPVMTFATGGASPDLLAYRMQALPGAETVDLATLRGRPGVLFVFEPGCTWCRRQARLLNELPVRCEGHAVQVLGVGIRGSRAALLTEARTLHPRFPLFEASHDFTAELDDSVATPLLLVFGGDGRIVTYARGYQRAEPLFRLLSDAVGVRCAN